MGAFSRVLSLGGERKSAGWMAWGVVGAWAVLAMAQPSLADGPSTTQPADGDVVADGDRDQPTRSERPEVIVTATRSEMEAFAAPYATQTVPLNDFRHQGLYRTLTKALEDVPSVMVQKTSHAQGSPYIRGFTGFRTLLLLDGIRLNNSVFRDGPNQYWNLVDPYTVERLEVVKGPSSVLYGSDAIGGTVNAILRRPDSYGDGFQWHRQIQTRVSTAERSYAARGEINATYEQWLGILAGGSLRSFGDVDGGGGVGPQAKTGYRQCSGDIRMELRPTDNSAWTFAHYQFYEDDAWRAHKTIYGISWEGTDVGSELRRKIDESHTLTYARYSLWDTGGFIDSLEVTASVQTLSETRFRIKSGGAGDHQGFDVNTYGLGMQFVSPTPIGRWTYGAEWYHDEVESWKHKFSDDGSFDKADIQGPVGDDASYDIVGAYIQNEIDLTDRLAVILGGRYTYARAAADRVKDPDTGQRISITEDWDALVGSARVSWFVDPQEHWNVFGGISQGFRAPNLSDLTRLDTARSDEIETPAPGLDPERFITYEAGVKAQYDDVRLQAVYYYTEIQDMIVRTPTGDIVDGDNEVTKKNAGDGYIQGLELAGRYRFHPQWTIFGSFSWMYGEVGTYPTSAPVKESEPLSRLMPPTGQFGVRWDHPSIKLYVEAICTVACKADDLSTRDEGDTQRIPPGGTPGYFVVDLKSGYQVTEGLDVWAGLDNVTNADYRVHGSGVNEPGINFKFGLKWKF